MLINTSINRSSFKAVGVIKGGVKFDKNDLSPAVLKIKAIQCLLLGVRYSNIFLGFLHVLLSAVAELFFFTTLVPSFTE